MPRVTLTYNQTMINGHVVKIFCKLYLHLEQISTFRTVIYILNSCKDGTGHVNLRIKSEAPVIQYYHDDE